MSSKEKVLQLLENNKNKYISGELIARKLGISRSAIWKAMNDLRSMGYDIDAVKNRGYCLMTNNDIISSAGIEAYLGSLSAETNIQVHSSLESTSRTAKELAIAGASHGTVVIADSQTSGKAHNGDSFLSPQGGLYMSVILDPEKLLVKEPSHISALGAVCVCQTIDELTDIAPTIKLITDIFSGDEKIGGILTESAFDFETNRLQWIVIGIGIPKKATGCRNQFAASIISKLLSAEMTDTVVLDYYRSHHSDN